MGGEGPKPTSIWARALLIDQQAHKREKIRGPAILITLVMKR